MDTKVPEDIKEILVAHKATKVFKEA